MYASPTGLYSSDNFSRRGVSYRVEANPTAATANIGNYEIGEMWYSISDAKYYFKTGVSTSEQVTSGSLSIADNSITSAKLLTGGHVRYDAVGHLTLGNTSVSAIRTDANLIISPGAAQAPITILLEPSTHGTSRRTTLDVDDWSIRQDSGLAGTKDLAIFKKTGSITALYIDAAGKTALGSTAPQAQLHVGAGTDAPLLATHTTLYVSNAGATNLAVRDSTNDVEITANASSTGGNLGTVTNHALRLKTNNTDRVLVDTQGNVGVGVLTSSAKAKFEIIGSSAGNITTLTDASTVTPDFRSNNYFSLTCTSGVGNTRTVANPTNPVPGQSGIIYITQDSTGGRSVTWGTNYKFPGGTAPSLTTTGNANDAVVYSVRTSSDITCQIVNDIR